MEGLIEEGEDYVKASGDKQVRDARFIGAAQRVETLRNGWVWHSAHAGSTRLGESETAESLQATLDEEEEADSELTAIAESEVNIPQHHRSVS
jgi:ferritin-like metal-binding protein YciE